MSGVGDGVRALVVVWVVGGDGGWWSGGSGRAHALVSKKPVPLEFAMR